MLEDLLGPLMPLLPVTVVLAAVVALLAGANFVLRRRYAGVPERTFRLQMLMLAATFAGILAVILALPVSQELKAQLLSLLGVVLSAAIALSSTTFVGNALAGVLLRVVKNFTAGDFLSVGEHFGRVSERGLFHTEIQTEDRDLTTLPNLFLVTQPVKVVRASGTIISATVSLGYDTPRVAVERELLAAADDIALEEPFVQILDLGDFSVTYRVAGMLGDVAKLLSTRSKLRGAMIDRLHAAGIEIVSPTFMNTRQVGDRTFIAEGAGARATAPAERAPEDVVFDKAEAAQALESASRPEAAAVELAELEKRLAGMPDDAEKSELEERLAALRQASGRQEGGAK